MDGGVTLLRPAFACLLAGLGVRGCDLAMISG
jgi:hypothetical protein